MYYIKVGNDIIFDQGRTYGTIAETRNVLDPVLSLEVNRAGSLTFTMDTKNRAYSTSKLDLMSKPVTVFQNERQIFEGRVVQDEYDFENKRKVTCEGCLAYLSDVIVPLPYTRNHNMVSLVSYLITLYNAVIKQDTTNNSLDRSFTYSLYDTSEFDITHIDEIIKDMQFKTVFEVLTSCLETCGGNMYVTFTSTGKRTLIIKNNTKISTDLFEKTNEPIVFAHNLLDLTQANDMTEYASVIYPLGKSGNKTDDEDDINKHKGGNYAEELVLDLEQYQGVAFDELGVMFTLHEERYVNPDDPDDPTQPMNYNISGVNNYRVWTMPVTPGKKFILTTINNKGFGLYAITNDFGQVLEYQAANSGSLMTTIVDKVITIPEGQGKCNLIIGYGSKFGTMALWDYINEDEEDELKDLKKHLGDDLLVTKQKFISQFFGCVNSDGTLQNYRENQSEGDNIRATDTVYAYIPVTKGKTYVYTTCQRFSHALVCLRRGTEAIDIVSAGSGESLTYKAYQKYTVPNIDGVLSVDLGGVVSNVSTHFWEYSEDEIENKFDKYITIESVNNGIPFVVDKEGIKKYGRIEKTITFDDISSPEVLKSKAINKFAEMKNAVTKVTVKALDVPIVYEDPDLVSYLPLQEVQLVSKPHGINQKMKVTRSELHLDKPENSTFEFEDLS